jgi:hypothetical protein
MANKDIERLMRTFQKEVNDMLQGYSAQLEEFGPDIAKDNFLTFLNLAGAAMSGEIDYQNEDHIKACLVYSAILLCACICLSGAADQ